MFVRTLPFEFSNLMLGRGVKILVNLIPMGERIEVVLRDGWAVEQVPTCKRFPTIKEKTSVPEVNVTYSQPVASKYSPSIQIHGKTQARGH